MSNVYLFWERRRKAIVAQIEATGGATTPASERKPSTFKAETPFDRTAVIAELDRLIESLTPDSIDPQSGSFLDNLINAWADEWIARLERAYATYQVTAVRELGATAGQLEAHRMLLEHDRNYQIEVDKILASVVSGNFMAGPRQSHRPGVTG